MTDPDTKERWGLKMIKPDADDYELGEDAKSWLEGAEKKLAVEMAKKFIASLKEDQKEIVLLFLLNDLDHTMTATEVELRKKYRQWL